MVKENKVFTASDGAVFKIRKEAIRHENEVIMVVGGFTVSEVNKQLPLMAETNIKIRAMLEIKPDWRDWSSNLVEQLPELINNYINDVVTYVIIKTNLWGRTEEAVLKVSKPRLAEGWYPKEFEAYLTKLEKENTKGSTFQLVVMEDEGTTVKYRVEEVKMSPEDKMNKGMKLDEDDIQTLLWERDEVLEEEGENRRWTRSMTTVIRGNDDNLYAIDWEQGLTESQENMFDEQPKRVELEEREVVTKVTNIKYL